MKFRWSYLIALAAAAILVAGAVRRAFQTSSAPQVHWKTANPLLAPKSQPMVQGVQTTAHTVPIALPRSQLASAEWYLPITAHSAISYILHDGRARWVVNGRAITLKNPTIDPMDQLSYAPDGLEIGWVVASGGVAEMPAQAPSSTIVGPARAISFNAYNVPVTIRASTVWVGSHPLAWTIPGNPASAHPLIGRGHQLIVDKKGTIESIAIPSGKTTTLARVRPNRWPDLLAARRTSKGVVWLMERPSAIPAYLLVSIESGRVFWYRFVSPTTPELGTLNGIAVVGNLESDGSLAYVFGAAIHPLNVTPGAFSSGPDGIIWQGSQGFVRLRGWSR